MWTACCLLALVPGFSLTGPQQKKLAKLAGSHPEAKAQYMTLRRLADASLPEAPDPVDQIRMEGLLNDDPAKIRTVAGLRDMRKIHALSVAFAVTGDAKYLDKAKSFILAWAKVNRPRGDPIDETFLEPLLFSYDLLRARFAEPDRAVIDRWLRGIAEAERNSAKSGASTSLNNWHSHRLKIVGLIGFLLQDRELTAWVTDAYRSHVGKNLNADGSSLDFHQRDALHYHAYDVEPLLTLAIAARQNGVDLYGFKSESGACLEKSVRFLVPFCDGTQTHEEFVHSTVAFDRKRSESGDAKYKAGRLFDPADGARVLELASAFDPGLMPLLVKVTGGKAKEFPTWQTVLNAVRR